LAFPRSLEGGKDKHTGEGGATNPNHLKGRKVLRLTRELHRSKAAPCTRVLATAGPADDWGEKGEGKDASELDSMARRGKTQGTPRIPGEPAGKVGDRQEKQLVDQTLDSPPRPIGKTQKLRPQGKEETTLGSLWNSHQKRVFEKKEKNLYC